MPRNPALDALESGSWKQLGPEEFTKFVFELRHAPLEVHTTAPEPVAETPPEAAPVQKSADGLGIVYRDNENALCADPVHPVHASEWPFRLFDDAEKDELLCDTMAFIIAELRKEWRGEMRQLQHGLRGPQGERGAPGHMPSVISWRGGIAYAGQLVHHHGSCWQASRDTAREPSEDSGDWQPVALGGGEAALSMQRALIERQRAEIGRLELRIAGLEARLLRVK